MRNIQEFYQGMLGKIKIAVVSDTLRRRLLFFFLNGALSLTSFIMTVVNFFTGEYILLLATLLFAVVCLCNLLILYFSRIPEKMIYYTFGMEAMILLAFFFISGIPDGFSALWICLIPSFALLIFGIRGGSQFSLLALAMMIFLFWIPAGRALLRYAYTATFMLRFPFLYSSIYLISLIIEYVRRETQDQLDQAKRQYRYLYRHDALTGLYNRYGIHEFMEEAFSGKKDQRVAVILLDIDDFKSINDHYGHECGDAVLKMVASVPLETMCEHCRCCRWGGEEFLLIMQCEHDPAAVAEKIRQKIDQTPVAYKGQQIHVTVSVGVSVTELLKDMTVHDLIDQADHALYHSKNHGKNQVTVRSGQEKV